MKCFVRVLLALAILGLLVALLGRPALPSLEGRPASQVLSKTEAASTALGRVVFPQAQQHAGKSGIYSLADAREAFATRVHLARSAQKTLDVQYYIWRPDITGTLLLEELHAAADRGVRVRLLMDDNGTAGLDDLLSALHSHPNIEVRLFNPFLVRKPKIIGFLTDFPRANRRMHNKSFTADGVATIIGGRNIGDEYFGAADGLLFADLDVLAIGAVVNDVSMDFDLYWASESSYPADLILPDSGATALQALHEAAAKVAESSAADKYTKSVRDSSFTSGLIEGKLAYEWAVTRMVSDDPAKGLGKAPDQSMLTHQLVRILDKPADNVELISSYFVPAAEGVEAFTRMARDGVKLRILTNSLHATDVAAVHAGYMKRRKDLLEAGIELYELRRMSSNGEGSGIGLGSGSGGGGGSGSGGGGSGGGAGPLGSSGSSLHAKTFSIDGKRVFVGSFNFDPRSALFNTELGFIIESPDMAVRIEESFKKEIPESSYEVRLSETGKVYWIERRDGRQIRHDTEPETGLLKRGIVRLLSWLPIEWML